ncbi:uncharacterized protein LODBEIA_P23340 [Lodderomyces beijingensis]|uniref:DUF155 domain-containing protein n=1 Tax=Lodderomyces beijingensis TaxID=1775926 RepID=A0ABP0ZIZ7_9ASCO
MSQANDDDSTPLLSRDSLRESSSGLTLSKSDDSNASKKPPVQPPVQPQPQQAFQSTPLGLSSSKKNANSKIGLQRTSRTTSKLKLLPEDPDPTSFNNTTRRVHAGDGKVKDKGGDDDDDDDDDDNDDAFSTRPTRVYSQAKMITDTSARKDAETLGKSHRDLLPRVTAYCTCASYKMKELLRWLKDRKRIHNTSAKLFDECLYTPFTYKDWRSDSSNTEDGNGHKLIRLADEGGEIDIGKRSDLFIFEYGVAIMWGFTQKEEAAFLEDLARFEQEKLSAEDIQVEEFNYYITKSYQPRIYNDFITLRDDDNYMLKLSISHALAQSVKISLFEELVDNTIEDTQDIPSQIARTGKVEMNRDEIMKSIGELFILRININLHGSVLDSPELMWAEPHLEPIYQATRGYLEINQRVELLNQRLEVISDLLQMLKEQLGHSHEESLEFIVVVLVGIEVLVSIINIVIDILTY